MDIATALRIVVERVEVNGDEEVELAIRTVEDALRLTPVISHGHLQPFHYVEWKQPDPDVEYEGVWSWDTEYFNKTRKLRPKLVLKEVDPKYRYRSWDENEFAYRRAMPKWMAAEAGIDLRDPDAHIQYIKWADLQLVEVPAKQEAGEWNAEPSWYIDPHRTPTWYVYKLTNGYKSIRREHISAAPEYVKRAAAVARDKLINS